MAGMVTKMLLDDRPSRGHQMSCPATGPTPPVRRSARESRGDRVAVGLVVNQNAAEVVAGIRTEALEDGAEVGLCFR
jgi:hypothetical protein